jgi:hypothetical protein
LKAKNGKDAVFRQRKGLEGFSPAAGGAGALAEPRKARFFAAAKNAPKKNRIFLSFILTRF